MNMASWRGQGRDSKVRASAQCPISQVEIERGGRRIRRSGGRASCVSPRAGAVRPCSGSFRSRNGAVPAVSALPEESLHRPANRPSAGSAPAVIPTPESRAGEATTRHSDRPCQQDSAGPAPGTHGPSGRPTCSVGVADNRLHSPDPRGRGLGRHAQPQGRSAAEAPAHRHAAGEKPAAAENPRPRTGGGACRRPTEPNSVEAPIGVPEQ